MYDMHWESFFATRRRYVAVGSNAAFMLQTVPQATYVE